MNNRIKVVDYKGTKIVVQDFSKADKSGVMHLLEQSKKILREYPKGSILVATNLKGVTFDKDLMMQFVETLETNKPFVRGSVFYGVEQHQKEALEHVGKMAERHFTYTATEEQACEHLIYS